MPSKSLDKLIVCMEEFRKLDEVMPMQMALCFVVVANNPGISMHELSKKTGLSQASCSRNTAALSEYHRSGKPGHNIVYTEPDPSDSRRKLMFLTAKGERILSTIQRALVST